MVGIDLAKKAGIVGIAKLEVLAEDQIVEAALACRWSARGHPGNAPTVGLERQGSSWVLFQIAIDLSINDRSYELLVTPTQQPVGH